MLPDGGLVETLHQKLQKRGRRTGLVSTATITHATPAGFAVNVDSRGKEELIAAQYLERQVDLLLGGGQKFFSPALRSHYQSAGYEIAESREVLLKLKPAADKKLLGLFSESHLPYSIDRSHDTALAEEVPTLAEMTQVALDWFGKTSEGFFLMVEGARIDHAGHQNDAATSIQDQLAFDDAIGTALGYLDGHPDTLLIITTDHGCGGIQMNGVNRSAKQGMAPGIYAGSTDAFRKLSGFRHSFEWMKQNGIDGLNGPKFAEALLQHTGIPLTADQLKTAQGLKLSTAEAFQAHHGIGWTGGNHTGDLVEFCAHGPGSDQFLPFMENHQIHALVLQALGLS
jgi:alkaline phosphatase